MKKYLPHILIILVGLTVANLAYAVTDGFWMSSLKEILAGLGNAALVVCSWVLGLAAMIFDKAIDMSVNNQILTGGYGMVKDGWGISRDLANMFFIFILIYIGISTILQLSGPGLKELLVKVIIIALLVNFSLFIGQTIISASNVLANQFYSAMKPSDPNLDLSDVFVGSLRLQSLYDTDGTSFGVGGREATATNILIISIMGCILTLVTAFVLFAGAALFIMRSVTLTLLLILAPLAFLAMALPKTKSYASQWWSTLLNQSFFAPAFLFLFYIVASIINKQGFKDFFGGNQAETGYAGIIFSSNGSPNVALLIQFVTLIMLMLACLQVARMMGGAGANSAINFATGIKNRALGYAGKISGVTGKFAGRKTIAKIGEKVAESKRMEQFAASKPRFGGWTREKTQQIAGAFGRKEQIEKQVARGMTLPPEQRALYLANLPKGMLGDKKAQEEMFRKLSYRERVELVEKTPSFESTYNQLLKTLPVEEREKTDKEFSTYKRKVDIGSKIKRLTDKTNPLKQNEIDELHKQINQKELANIIQEGEKETVKALFDSFKAMGTTMEDVAQKFSEIGNNTVAAFFHGPAGRQTLKAYGFTEPQKEPKNKQNV